jgi:hypothetical protein
MNCSEKEFSVSYSVKYDKNGNLKKLLDSNNSDYEKIIPSSLMFAVYKYICETE